MSVHRLKIGVAVSCAVLSLAGSVQADNWPQWRGPTNDGICHEKGLPTTWTATDNVAWSLKLPGMGSSTPAIWGDKIFLTSEEGDDVDLLCVSTAGKELWRKKLGSSNHGKKYRGEGNYSSASPSTDGKLIVTFTGNGDLACHDLAGEKIWGFNVQEQYGAFKIMWGMHTTPLLHNDRIYLTLLHSGGRKIVALDKATGKEVWAVKRADDAKSECEQAYTSPTLWQKGDQECLVVLGNDYCTGHRLKDGEEIWRVGDLNPKTKYNAYFRFVASPLATEDLIVIPTAKGGPVVGLKPDAKGLVLPGSASEQWRRPKDTPDVPAPLLHNGLVYLCREDGKLICMDAKTGKQHYFERTHASNYRASPVYADGKIYLTAQDGVITVVKEGPKFEILATNSLSAKSEKDSRPETPAPQAGGRGRRGGPGGGASLGEDSINASPAISNGRIYLRTIGALYAIEQGKKLIN
jgi:outer membrane protein assembly factor BamB